MTLSGTSDTSRVSQMPVDVNALSIVGVAPLLGRTYRHEDFDDVVKQKEARSIVVSPPSGPPHHVLVDFGQNTRVRGV